MLTPYTLSQDGIELQFATNHKGSVSSLHFSLFHSFSKYDGGGGGGDEDNNDSHNEYGQSYNHWR